MCVSRFVPGTSASRRLAVILPSHPVLEHPVRILIKELALTPQEFNLKFKGSPVKRAKRRGYLRNVAVALGNAGDPSAVPAIGHALLNDHEPLVRGHAAWALGCIGDENAIAWLEESALQEGDSYVLGEINLALKREADI